MLYSYKISAKSIDQLKLTHTFMN